LHCVDASAEALAVARAALSTERNVLFHEASVDALPFEERSLDFAYSLGVLHHLPDTAAAFQSIARVLKKGAPLLVYLYYAFDNRPAWYRLLWRISDGIRQGIVRLPPGPQFLLCDAIAVLLYWPLAILARLAERAGLDVGSFPLAYRRRDFYSMRTDARDRFGTPLEKRFRAEEIRRMMQDAGFENVRIPARPPYWCAMGFKRSREPERSAPEREAMGVGVGPHRTERK
jgi:ubiquinone/menaquinone biosynthesis C-methylase UbiE